MKNKPHKSNDLDSDRWITSPLSDDLNKRLITCALAAGAAGIGLLSSARPAAAEIICSPKDIHLT